MITYNPTTGEFFRNGERCDSDNGNGRRCVKYHGKTVRAHRLAWFLHYGIWPEPNQEVDHINGNPSDNRICNLRLVTKSENNFNRTDPKNTSGERGVAMIKCAHAWGVKVKAGALTIHKIASHKISAIVAARLIRRTLHGEFAVDNRTTSNRRLQPLNDAQPTARCLVGIHPNSPVGASLP